MLRCQSSQNVGDDAATSSSVATFSNQAPYLYWRDYWLSWKNLSECRLQPTAAHSPTGGCKGRGTMSAGKRLAPTLQSTLARCAPQHSTQSSKCQPDLGGSGWQVSKLVELVKVVKHSSVYPANAKPIFVKARPVPYAEQELERLQGLGVIVLLESSEWAAPVVPVVKSDGSVHICGNFRLKSKD